MPAVKGHNATHGVPMTTSPLAVRGFTTDYAPSPNRPYVVSGVTRDSVGAPLGSCTVHLYLTADDTEVWQDVSDANGNFSLPASQYLTYYLVAYLPGSPDRAGTTVNTLVGT